MIAAQASVLSVGGAAYGTQVEPAWVDVEHVTLSLPRLHPAFDGFRFAQISDIHMGGWMNREHFAHVVDLVNATKPELLLITGDFIEDSIRYAQALEAVQDVETVLSSISSIPVMVILGNHDYRSGMAPYLLSMFARLHFIELINSVHTIARGDGQLHFAGVDDILKGSPDLSTVILALPKDGAAILLSHEPDFADTSSTTGRFDLQISGHSHGGQVALPFFGPIVLPNKGKKYFNGLYHVGNMLQYTNRGVGMTSPYVRFNCRPEITVFTLMAE